MRDMKKIWDDSFEEQVALQGYNTAPVEALARSAAYYFRDRFAREQMSELHFLEMGCGAGPNLIWLANRGVRVSGIDISPKALELCRKNFERHKLVDCLVSLQEGSVEKTPFADCTFDGIFEACVFQHLDRGQRQRAFNEVRRLLKPGGLFVGYLLDTGHTVYQTYKAQELNDDPGTIDLKQGGSKIYLTNIGLSHFFTKEELKDYLAGFSVVDPCLSTYYLPESEAKKRGYEKYLQSQWIVYAIK